MAILTNDDLTELRHACEKVGSVNYTKSQLNAASQAIEDWFENIKLNINKVIDTATAPIVLSAQQKRELIAHFLRRKFEKEDS